MLRLRAPEILEEVLGPDEIDAEAVLDGAEAEGDREMRLAHAGRAEEQDIGRFGHEGQGGELLDLALIDRWLKSEVKLVERALKWQMGQACPGPEVPLASDARLAGQKIGQEVSVGQLLLRGRLEPALQDSRRLHEAEMLEGLPGLRRGDHRPAPTSWAYCSSARTSTVSAGC